MAPELIAGDYDAKADVWSLGVICFMLLSSSMPFYGRDRSHIIKRILRGKFDFSARRWRYVSDTAKDFVKSLLRRRPEKRPSADAALNLPWLLQDFNSSSGKLVDLDQLDDIQAAMHAFGSYETLKKLALMVVAYKSTNEEIGFLRKTFSKFDTSNDGEITLDEFKAALAKNYTYTNEEMEELFRGIDIDGTGKVHYMEFLGATLEAHGSIDEERLAEAFDRIDCDDSGTITVKDLKDFLGEDLPEAYLEKLIDEVGVSSDHVITYDDFLSLWNSQADEKRRDAKANAGSRHVSRANSFTSSLASSNDLTDSDAVSDASLQLSTDESRTGSYYYQQHRVVSIRNNSLTASAVNRVLVEKGLITAASLRKFDCAEQIRQSSIREAPDESSTRSDDEEENVWDE
jgi:calcium-dependent protein kinase